MGFEIDVVVVNSVSAAAFVSRYISVSAQPSSGMTAEATFPKQISVSAGVTSSTLFAEAAVNGIVNIGFNGEMASIYIAGENLGGDRVVMIENGKAVYYNPLNANNTGKKLGVTKFAAALNDFVSVIHIGNHTSGGWGLTEDAVYYAAPNGTITTVIPTIGIFQRVGVGISTDTLLVSFSEPIVMDDGVVIVDAYVDDDYVDDDYVN